MNKDKIEIRSEEVQEVMGHVPTWIVRWGITLLFITILILLIGSWFFKYPDVIKSSVIVTTENPPASVMARSSGKIEILFVQDTQEVNQNQHLAIIENPADYHHVFELQGQLDSIKTFLNQFDTSRFFQLKNYYSLGEIQTGYAGFLKLYADYQHFIKLNYHSRKISSLNEEFGKYAVYYNQLNNQKRFLEEQLEITNLQYARDSKLFKQDAIPPAEYEKSKNRLLEKKYSFEQARISLSYTKIQVSKLEQNILDLELEYIEQKKRQELALAEAYDNLTAQIPLWEQKYLLKAPINGTVTFTKFWSKNQNVNVGEKVITIIPINPGNLIGKINLPIRGSGKVKPGQIVNIKFANFPHMEFGMVRGIIKSISLVPNDNNYTVEVDLPNELTTFYGKTLEFNQEMQGTAEIITEDLRLLERIVDPIKFLLEKHVKNNK